jgi:geranylgeranyl diphosphate synthase, type II
MDSKLSAMADPICREVESLLAQCLDRYINSGRLREAASYAVMSGGKRIRPLLAYGAADACGSRSELLMHGAAAVEMIHAYSLVHDDLPSMDDDDLRRGKPTVHVAFDEATAVLAGDALQNMAYEVLTNAPASDARKLICLQALTEAAGGRGMVSGQMMDIEQVGEQVSLQQLQEMHSHKTGALIRASVRLGGISSTDANSDQLDALDEYAKALGLAFQIRDDIIDQISSTEVLGKTQGADQALNKPNYVDLLGLEAAQEQLEELHERAGEALQSFGENALMLRLIADFVVQRLH